MRCTLYRLKKDMKYDNQIVAVAIARTQTQDCFGN